jgi:hypothetical protein
VSLSGPDDSNELDGALFQKSLFCAIDAYKDEIINSRLELFTKAVFCKPILVADLEPKTSVGHGRAIL